MNATGHKLQFQWTGSDLRFYVDNSGPFFSTANFQAGVDTLYNKCVSCGQTPNDKSPTSISNAIQGIYGNRYTEGYNNGYSAGYDASAIGGFLGAEYQLQGSRDVVASFSKYSGIVIICISIGWQYGVGGDLNLSVSPTNYELIYGLSDWTGGTRIGAYISRIVIKTNLDTIPNKEFTIHEDGLNTTIKYYNALVFRAS